jgi:invasion protein IalB
MYDDEPPRRRRSLVPLLAIIAVVLALAIAAGVVFVMFGNVLKPGVSAIASKIGAGAPGATAPANDASPLTPSAGDQSGSQTDVPKAIVSVAPAAEGEPPVRSTHGDWQVRCDTPAGAQNEQCVLMQFVTAEDRDNVGLTVIVLKTADKKARIVRILAPLGVLLPSGLGLKVDNTDMGRAGFVRCLPNGCVAEVILEDKLLTALRSGTTATFIIFQTPEEGIGIPISLNGFGEGFDALP